MAVFEVDSTALIAAATAIGGGLGAGLTALGRYLRDMQRETNQVVREAMRVMGRTEAVADLVERDISSVVEVPPELQLTPAERAAGYSRPTAYPRAKSEPRRGG